jgi:cation efflux family protein/sulfatase-modifying factor enzyme 1
MDNRNVRTLDQRRSATALRRAAAGDSIRTVAIAFLANLLIAVAKLIAGLVSRSTGMLAEAAHSAADSINEVFHVSATSAIAPLSNFSGKGLAPHGQYHGMSAVGAFDMAGNVKEWCFNATSGDRFILGGAWNEPVYMFSEADGQPAFSRTDNFGFRLVKNDKVNPSLTQPVEYPHRDFSKETPVTKSVFDLMRGLYAYDKPPLRASVDAVDDSDEHWRKEKVSYDAAYGNERISAYVFLPRHTQPPYQTVVYFPGSSVILTHSSAEVQPEFGAAVIRSGRAFVLPIYKSTYERGTRSLRIILPKRIYIASMCWPGTRISHAPSIICKHARTLMLRGLPTMDSAGVHGLVRFFLPLTRALKRRSCLPEV